MVRVINGASVIGIRRTSFTGNNGEPVHGYNVYFTYPLTADGSEGDGCGQLYLSIKAFKELSLCVGEACSVARVGNKFELVT